MKRTWSARGWWALLLLAWPVGLLALDAVPSVWNSAWENEPDGVESANLLDENINVTKEEIRRRLEVEHHVGNFADAGETAGDDNGLHRVGSARCFVQATAPAVIEQKDYDNDGASPFVGSATLSVQAQNSVPSETIGLGRCWIDTNGVDGINGTLDDNQLWVYNGGWVPAATNSLNLGKFNLVYNSHWAATTPTGGSTSALTGWALSNATIAYGAPLDIYGQAVEAQVTATAANGAMTQTLTGLKAVATYFIMAQVDPDDTGGTDSCDLLTTGGSINASDTTSGLLPQTLGGTFTTTAAPAAVVLRLESNANTDRCDWSSVSVYELSTNHGISDSGIVPATDQDAYVRTAVVGSVTLPTINPKLTVPSPGGVIVADAGVNVTATGAANMTARVSLQYAVNGGAPATCRQVEIQAISGGGSDGEVGRVTIHCMIENPNGGDTYEFTLLLEEVAGNLNYGDPTSGAETDTTDYIDAVWYPVR